MFTGTVAGQIVKLPNATTLNIGHRYEIWNLSTQFLTISDNGSNSLIALSSEQKSFAVLRDNSTSNGIWVFEANFIGGTGGGNGSIVFAFDGNAVVGRWLENAANVPTDLTKCIIAGNKNLRAISMATNGASTCTVTIFKNGVALNTISTSAIAKNTKLNLSHPLVDKDEISAQVTSGSSTRPVIYIWI
jgi:hypothetical protein